MNENEMGRALGIFGLVALIIVALLYVLNAMSTELDFLLMVGGLFFLVCRWILRNA